MRVWRPLNYGSTELNIKYINKSNSLFLNHTADSTTFSKYCMNYNIEIVL